MTGRAQLDINTDKKEQTQNITDLKSKLKQCIKQEKYEEAAKIRDTIKKIEEGGNINE